MENSENRDDARVEALSSLIYTEQQAREAETHRDLAYVMVNDVQRVLPCRQAFFFRLSESGAARLQSAAGISSPDNDAPVVQSLQSLVGGLTGTIGDEKAVPMTIPDLPEQYRAVAEAEMAPYLLLVALRHRNGHLLGVLLLASEAPWNEAHVALGEVLGESFSHAWRALEQPEARRRVLAHLRGNWKRYLIGIVVLLLLPVRQYVLAPAEVISADPQVVAAPMDGVVREVLVEPGEQVEQGTALFSMDDTDLSNQLAVAAKALDVAQAEYLRNAQEAFQCDDCRGKVPRLKAVVEREKAKLNWAREQLARSRVRAPVGGVVVFENANDWKGRPVKTGEKVMLVADPDKTRLRVTLPVGDAIATAPGTRVVFYPNVSPLSSYDATLSGSAYEARQQPNQTLAFELIAGFAGEPAPLGWRGTAKLYGDRAPVAYLLLRKPLAWLRRTLGI